MKKRKSKLRIILTVAISLTVVAILVAGIVILRANNNKAYVAPVSDLDGSAWINNNKSFSAVVEESAEQSIFIEPGQTVKEVFVKQGDKVKKGDKLFKHDTELIELNIEEKQLSVDICQTHLAIEQKKLDEYKAIVPVAAKPTEPEPSTEEETVEEPENNSQEEFSDSSLPEDSPAADEPAEDTPTYTAEEKATMISDQTLVVKKVENALELAKAALDEAKRSLEDSTVKAGMSGEVKKIGKPGEDPADGSSFCVISGDGGVTLSGALGEFDQQTLKIGDRLSVTSWMSGATAEAEVTAIDDYPLENSEYYSSGNPNSSMYRFTAVIDDASGFEIGESVDAVLMTEATGAIVLEKIYVRSDKDGSYVMADADGRLERRPVTTARSSDSGYIIITSGLSTDDYIAFPYGIGSEIGAKTTTEMQFSLF